ncbi:hypothetical protein [Epilithonimonas zeae]|uniref:hypothetical protein n=1 Tax=Epilithonimonas zeae TaxID=1416779 RepID=UPI00200E2E37|nr:hypothetical protein [Epilithonimonas zeae]UQB70632.1 hypothetical protein KI430_04950 [Epilithonimonas zeae]
MSKRKAKKHCTIDGSNKFDPESIMKFQEMKLNLAIKILEKSGIFVSEEEASEILSFLNFLAKITIKEFLLNEE